MPEKRAARGRRADDEPAAEQDRDQAEADEPEADEPEPDRQSAKPDRKRGSGNSGNGGLSAAEAAKIGLREIAELTGKQPEGVTGVELGEDSWVVGVEVVEDSRVPSSADILATYEAEFDLSGELLSYRRVRRYARGRGEES